MSEILSAIWFIIGGSLLAAGKDFTKVAICFLVCGVFMGVCELKYMRREMEDWEEDD